MSFNRIILSYYDQGRIESLAGEVGFEPTKDFYVHAQLTVGTNTILVIRQLSSFTILWHKFG